MEEGYKIQNSWPSKIPQEQRFLRIKINRYIINHNNNKSHSKFNTRPLHNNSQTIMNNKNSYLTPEIKRFKNFNIDNCLSSLNSEYKKLIKSSIKYSNTFCLIQKKLRILKAKKLKDMISKSNSKELEKKTNKAKSENIKQKLLLKNFKNLKEKEENERKIKVKNMKEKNNKRMDIAKEERSKNNEKISIENRILKMQRLNEAFNEKNRIKGENLKKKDIIKSIDNEISKRKEQSEKLKKKIKIDKLIKEIKLEEELNRKILKKIKQYENTGLNLIEKF